MAYKLNPELLSQRLLQQVWRRHLRGLLLVVQSLSRVQLFATPWTVAHQAPLTVGFPRQEYWSGLPFPSLGDLPDPGIEPSSPALAGSLFTSAPVRKPDLMSTLLILMFIEMIPRWQFLRSLMLVCKKNPHKLQKLENFIKLKWCIFFSMCIEIYFHRIQILL